MPGLGFLHLTRPTAIESTVYDPVVCLILQGRKRTVAGTMSVDFGPGESLIVSHDLPVHSQVTACPYLALILSLDIAILRGLVREVDEAPSVGERAAALDVDRTEGLILDALARYVSLIDRPLESRVLGPRVFEEIHFRLLMAPHGGMLRTLLRRDSNASHVYRAVRTIREQFRSPLSVPELARSIGMSESAFYRHFKAITGTTPLQYQKSMRLLEARRLISAEGRSVSRAAVEVGYGSPTQFSREYVREFGAPPRTDARVR